MSSSLLIQRVVKPLAVPPTSVTPLSSPLILSPLNLKKACQKMSLGYSLSLAPLLLPEKTYLHCYAKMAKERSSGPAQLYQATFSTKQCWPTLFMDSCDRPRTSFRLLVALTVETRYTQRQQHERAPISPRPTYDGA